MGMALCIAAVLVYYFWIDRPVAFFVYHHQINKFQVFRWLTYPPPELQTWSPLVLTVLMVRRAWGPFVRWQKVLLVACLSLIVADEFRTSLGDVCGRYWPETWSNDNPSLIGNGRYGFHPFQRGDDIGSFPSGHAGRILGFATVWLIATPLQSSHVLPGVFWAGLSPHTRRIWSGSKYPQKISRTRESIKIRSDTCERSAKAWQCDRTARARGDFKDP